MPTYEYECTTCGERFEREQHMTDAPVAECPSCGGAVRKVFHAFGISVRQNHEHAHACTGHECPFAKQCGVEH